MATLTVAGEPVVGERGSYPVYNPVRPLEVVHEAPWTSPAQLDATVAAARAAAPGWAALPLEERCALVRRAAEAVPAAVGIEETARLLTREHGKILVESLFDIASIPPIAGRYCLIAARALAPWRPDGAGSNTLVSREPHGVVAVILPFNWPPAIMATKVLPALIAGNTVIVKPPPTCPGAVLAVVAALAAELPPGVVGSVNGPGAELGEALVAHPGVDMLSVTSGIATGRAVMMGAAARLRPVVLELGGNDAAILAPDIEVDDVLAGRLLDAAFVTSGQVCLAIKRLYVPRETLPEVVEALRARCSAGLAGDGLADGVTMGPLHSARARDFVEGLVAEAERQGARVHRAGGVRAQDATAGGHLVGATIVEDPPPDAAIVREEQFGPALPVLGYRDLDDAVAQANATDYGLCASIWSGDPELADAIAPRLEAGTVFVNGHGPAAVDSGAPFGGWKQSGIGVEWGVEGLRGFTRLRTVVRHAPPAGRQ